MKTDFKVLELSMLISDYTLNHYNFTVSLAWNLRLPWRTPSPANAIAIELQKLLQCGVIPGLDNWLAINKSRFKIGSHGSISKPIVAFRVNHPIIVMPPSISSVDQHKRPALFLSLKLHPSSFRAESFPYYLQILPYTTS